MFINHARWAIPVCAISLGVVICHSQSAQEASRLAPTVADFAYGDHERQVLDFYRAQSSSPTPLVLYIHGGGFTGGNKSGINQRTLSQLLDVGISVAAINYRLAGQVPLPAAHRDVQRALQTLRTRAREWKFDKNQVGAFGGSAGAQLCMWLAYGDDIADPASNDPIARESTRLAAVAPLNGQSTMDFDWWRSNIPGYDTLHRDPAGIFGTDDRAEQSAIAKDLSAVSLVSADDPPTYMRYSMAPGDPIPEGDRARGWKVHHVRFGLLLKERLTGVGVEAHLSYPGAESEYLSVAEFFAAKFGQL